MAIITSATTGLYGATGTWVGGVVPVLGDSVVIARTSTGLETFSTDATGYIAGSTVIVLTGTVLAGSFVVGESVQFDYTDPNYYTITAWVVATKTLTITALVNAIPAVATLVKCRGHVVTVDGTYSAGDDTTTAFTISGTLRASRITNNVLTIRGLIQTSATVCATIDYGRKSYSDAIPSGVTARLILNSSAALAVYKYGIYVGDTSNGFFCGANKTKHSTITAGIAAAATSAIISDATGWLVNDWVVFAATTGTASQNDRKQILTITPGAGATATITFAAVSFAHALNGPVGNFTSNVQIEAFSITNAAYICFRNSLTTSNGRREIDSISIENCGSNTANVATQVFVSGNGNTCSPFVSLSNFSVYNGNNSAGLFMSQFISPPSFKMTGVVFYTDNGLAGFSYYQASGTTLGFDNCLFIFHPGNAIAHAFSQGPQGVIYSNSKFMNVNNAHISHTNGDGVQVNDCTFGTAGFAALALASGSTTFNRCFLGSSQAPGTPVIQYMLDASGSNGSVGNHTFNDCYFGTPVLAFTNRFANGNQFWKCTINRKNADVLQNEFYTSLNSYYQDNVIFKRSKSSLRVLCDTATKATYDVTFLAISGTAYTIKGYLRKNASYGAATLPSVTISGLGIVPVVFTMTNSVDTWEPFVLTATQTSGVTGNLTITLTTQSTSTAGLVYLDGLPIAPFVTFARHYGSLFNVSSLTTTVDTIILQTTEATVGAYTGIAIAGSTITMTVSHTVRELYDYCKYYLCQTANLSVADFFTSTDGVNFTGTYNLTVDGCTLSGAANIDLGAMALSVINGGLTVPIIKYASGTRVNMVLTGLVTNSRVQLYDVTGTTELYNAVVAATSLTVPIVWTTNKSIRYRVSYCVGTNAYNWVEATGTLTNTGMNITIAQTLDTIYNSIAIDGSTVTECSISGTILIININDPDNTTAAQRLLAFEIYWLYTAGGIRDQNLYISYADSTHLIFEGGLKIKNSKVSLPLSITGASMVPRTGQPADIIDSTGGSININTSLVVNYSDPTKYLTVSKFLALK